MERRKVIKCPDGTYELLKPKEDVIGGDKNKYRWYGLGKKTNLQGIWEAYVNKTYDLVADNEILEEIAEHDRKEKRVERKNQKGTNVPSLTKTTIVKGSAFKF